MEFASVLNLRTGAVLANFAKLAMSPEERRRGLLDRSCLPKGEGLLLATDAIHTIGMKFPIDVVFFETDAIVIGCVPGMKPGKTTLCEGALCALELPEGTIESTETGPGDQLQIDYF